MTGLREALFDAAFESLVTGSPTERRNIANEAAALIIGALGESDRKAALKSRRSRLETLLGIRAAAKLSRVALASMPSRVRLPKGRQPKLAILTSKETAGLATALCDGLSAAGADVWFYERSIKIGRRIRIADESALESADYVVLLVSRAALSSNFVDYELDIVHWLEMKDRRERLLPVIADDLAFDELPPILGPIEAVSATALGVQGVLAAIADRLAEDRPGGKRGTAR